MEIQRDIFLLWINQGQNKGIISEEISLINSQKEWLEVQLVQKVTEMTFPDVQNIWKRINLCRGAKWRHTVLPNTRYEDTFLNLPLKTLIISADIH